MFEAGVTPPDRFVGVWARPAPIIEGMTLACRIHTPWYAATIQEHSLDARVTWLSPAPPDHSVEVALFLSQRTRELEDWPWRTSMMMEAVGSFELNGGGCVWAVAHHCPAIHQKLPPISAARYFRGKAEKDMLIPGARVMMWGRHGDGSIIIQEVPVIVAKTD
jgi:hypothetical protein